MSTTLNSIDNLLTQSANKGPLPIWWMGMLSGATTVALTTSGYITAQRFPNVISFASPLVPGSGVTGAYLTYCRVTSSLAAVINLVGIEYTLGTLTVGGAFAGGSTMPTKTVNGLSLQTAATDIFLVATVTLVATTPVITITYTNQDGVTNRTATLTLPTNVLLNSVFLVQPHLQAGDTGIRAVTNMSTSAGSSGTLKVFGVLPLAESGQGVSYVTTTPDPLTIASNVYLWENGENIAFYRFGTALGNIPQMAALNFIASD